MWYVYLLLCDNKTFYVGISNDLVQRINNHSCNRSLYTCRFSVIKLAYCERYAGKKDALKREKQIKGWNRAKKQMLIDGKLGVNCCTEVAKALFASKGLSKFMLSE